MNGNGWTGAVLAGGQSSRMGRDKALIELEGRTLLDRAMDLVEPLVSELLVIGDPEKYGHVGPFVIGDVRPGKGPLGGLVTALRYASNDRVLLLACDMPNIDARLLQHVMRELESEAEAVVPRHTGGAEPLVAAYHRGCLPTFQRCIDDEVLKMTDALALVEGRYLDIEPGTEGWSSDLFHNINAPSDL